LLRDSVDTSTVVGLRDRAIITTLIYTARRVLISIESMQKIHKGKYDLAA